LIRSVLGRLRTAWRPLRPMGGAAQPVEYSEHLSSEVLKETIAEGLKAPGKGGLVASVYRELAAKRCAGEAALRRAVTASDAALESAIVDIARVLTGAGARNLTCILPWFGHWLRDYAAFIASVRAAGYEFRTMEDCRTVAPKRSILMRYDVHLRDLPVALGFAEANRLLGVASEFHLPLRYSRQYTAAGDDLDLLCSWLAPMGKPAFHAASFESHLIWTYFNGDEFAFSRWARSEEAVHFVADLMAGRETAFGSLAALMAKADETFATQAAAFKALYPGAVSCSGHGGALNARLVTLRLTDECAGTLQDMMGGRLYITNERATRAGFIGEVNETCTRLGMDYVSDVPDRSFTAEMQAVIDSGRSAALVIHPALVQRGHYAFEPVLPGKALRHPLERSEIAFSSG
jgi:hypothetical protein